MTATEAPRQGEPAGRATDAIAGASANPAASKDPAAMQTAACPARMIPVGTAALRSLTLPQPTQPVEAFADYPTLLVGNPSRPSCDYEHKLAFDLAEEAAAAAAKIRTIMMLFR